MGSGTFSASSSATRAAFRASTGTSAFTYDADVRAGRASGIHSTLDLRLKQRRESRDNADSVASVPIGIIVDVTGSMGRVSKNIIDGLHKVISVVQGKGVIEYPQILFGAVGDAYSDEYPIQVGEFEASDELAEACLANIIIEGNGGGQNRESYDIPMWFFANQVDTDAWEKRGQKGYLFIIGDEGVYENVSRSQILDATGIDIESDIPTKAVVDKLQEKWEVFCLRPGGTGAFADYSVRASWKSYLPNERVIDVQNWEEIVPTIAATLSLMGGLSLSDTLAALKDNGMSVTGTSNALASVGNSATLAVSGSTDLLNRDDTNTSVRL